MRRPCGTPDRRSVLKLGGCAASSALAPGIFGCADSQEHVPEEDAVPDVARGGEKITLFLSGDVMTGRGIDLQINLNRTHRLGAQLNYSYSDVRGTGSDKLDYYGAVYRNSGIPGTAFPLDFAREHKGSVLLDYRFGENDGSAFLQNSGINLLFTASSGHPYTHSYDPPYG